MSTKPTDPSDSNQSPLSAEKVWEMALSQLQMQMTQATFDSWVKETHVIGVEKGTWQVRVKSDSAKEWLENRLYTTIQRTVSAITSRPVEIEFVVDGNQTSVGSDERQAQLLSAAQNEILSFDVYEAGYINHAHYIQRFWGPLIGADAMQVWSYIRSFYKEPRYIYDRTKKGYVPNPNWIPWTPARTFRASDLARAITSKEDKSPNRRKITGGWVTCKKFQEAYDNGIVWDSCRQCGSEPRKVQLTQAKPSKKYPQGRPTCRYWQQGVFDMFKAEGIGLKRPTGDPTKPRTIFYEIQVYQLLPFLAPAQADRLNKVTRQEHLQELRSLGMDLKAWYAFGDIPSLLPLAISWAGATIDPKQT